MICVCERDEYDWPNMDKTCPIHNQPKTMSEWWYTILGWLKLYRMHNHSILGIRL